MDREKEKRRVQYTPETWREVDALECTPVRQPNQQSFFRSEQAGSNPDIREQTRDSRSAPVASTTKSSAVIESMLR